MSHSFSGCIKHRVAQKGSRGVRLTKSGFVVYGSVLQKAAVFGSVSILQN